MIIMLIKGCCNRARQPPSQSRKPYCSWAGPGLHIWGDVHGYRKDQRIHVGEPFPSARQSIREFTRIPCFKTDFRFGRGRGAASDTLPDDRRVVSCGALRWRVRFFWTNPDWSEWQGIQVLEIANHDARRGRRIARPFRREPEGPH